MLNKLKNIYCANREVINYLVFGVLTTIINLATYFILTAVFLDANNGLELQTANVIAWVVAVIFAYATNRKYVFDSQNEDKVKEVVNFFIARLATLFVDMIIMYLGVNVLSFNDKIVKIVSQFTVIASNYILSKLFVFKKKES